MPESASARLYRILMVHNAYQQRGGEDSVVDAEIELLRAHGHEVIEYRRHNDDLTSMPKARAAVQTIWSAPAYRDVSALIEQHRPDIIHAHNTFPLISPSLYWAARRARTPVVQTLHNFRLLCPQAMLLREGKVCEDCVGHLPWRGALRGCYRGSKAQSTVLAAMLTVHRGMGTWSHQVTRYIALNEFCKNKFIEGGLPAERISIKPNFLDSEISPQWEHRRRGLFVGRLSEEKGLNVLAQAVRAASLRDPIQVIGGGELAPLAQAAFGEHYLGFKSLPEILQAMQAAAYLVVPSIWYENFPRTIVEAFACGLPVIASRLGALADIVRDGETGLLFEPANPQDLANKLLWAQAHPQRMVEMGRAARAEYERRYTSARNYEMLVDIYQQVARSRD